MGAVSVRGLPTMRRGGEVSAAAWRPRNEDFPAGPPCAQAGCEEVAGVALLPYPVHQVTGSETGVAHQDEMRIGFSQRVIAIDCGERVGDQLLGVDEPRPRGVAGLILAGSPDVDENSSLGEDVEDVGKLKASLGHSMIHQQVAQSHVCTV